MPGGMAVEVDSHRQGGDVAGEGLDRHPEGGDPSAQGPRAQSGLINGGEEFLL